MEPFGQNFPTNLEPSFILRSRREMNAVDATNTRLVNYWYNDTHDTQRSDPFTAMDMNPTPSRLYREDLDRSQPYVIRSLEDANQATKIQSDISDTLRKIQWLQTQDKTPDIAIQLKETSLLYNSLTIKLKNANTNSLGSNPYFNKYDIASDPRNVIRELRGVVSEDVVDRGLAESQKLLQRGSESRWNDSSNITGEKDEKAAKEALLAFELLRPRFNNMENNYLR
jgi:hypothetical protein